MPHPLPLSGTTREAYNTGNYQKNKSQLMSKNVHCKSERWMIYFQFVAPVHSKLGESGNIKICEIFLLNTLNNNRLNRISLTV